MTRTSRWISALLLALSVALPAAAGAAETKPLTVVELFTSQGCSSCPPADRYLGELAKRPDILALSEHVDYWDYIGWKDVFASPEITARQRVYARKMGLRYVYTPQMVVQGRSHATGSDRDTIERLIREAAALPRQPVEVETGTDGVTIVVPEGETRERVTVWLAAFDDRHDVEVRRGENAGRTLSYHNVVREMRRLGEWDGKAVRFPVDATEMQTEGYDGCAVLLQGAESGRILGAARFTL